MFSIGEKVVCVADISEFAAQREIDGDAKFPILNEVYTVRGFREDNGIYIFLAEIKNKEYSYKSGLYEPAFAACWFKKVIETDISVFQEIAANPHKRMLEHV